MLIGCGQGSSSGGFGAYLVWLHPDHALCLHPIHWVGGFFQTVSMLAGVLFGLILYLVQGKVSFSVVGDSLVFSAFSLWGCGRRFRYRAVWLSMVFTYLAVMINTVGSIQGISEIAGKED